VFLRSRYPHCEAAKTFLNDLRRERPSLQIAVYDIAENPAARRRRATLFVDRGMTSVGVPTFLIGTELHAGRWLKLSGGGVMVRLGIVLILKPEWLAL
jgi:hypothetical protein